MLRQLAEACLLSPLNSPDLSLAKQCPMVYHDRSNYNSGEVANARDGCPRLCSLPFRQAEEGSREVKKRGVVMFDMMVIQMGLLHELLDHQQNVVKNRAVLSQ